MTQDAQKKTVGIAIVSLVFGIFFWFPFLGIIFSITALITGIIAAKKVAKNQDTLKGKGMAIAGIVLGGIGTVLTIILFIVGILSAIAIPNLIEARSNAAEANAAAAMHTIVAAEVAYRATHASFASLTQLADQSPPYIDATLGSGTKQGYMYKVEVDAPNEFFATAKPQYDEETHSFYVDQIGILCISDTPGVRLPTYNLDGYCPEKYSKVQ